MDRREGFEEQVSPWLSRGKPLRVSGVDGAATLDPDEANTWKNKVRYENRALMGRKPPSEKRLQGNLRPTRASYTRALGLRGCELSHRKALETALGHPSRPERFLVLEDDARIRWDVYSKVEVPEPLPDVILWGGFVRGSHLSDAEIPAARHAWQSLQDGLRLRATHAYELSRAAGEHLLKSLMKDDSHVDQGGMAPTIERFQTIISRPQTITTARFEYGSLTRGGVMMKGG